MAGSAHTAAEAADAVVAALKAAGIDLVATLPDAWLGETIARIEADPAMTLVRVCREEEGVGICAGAFLGGRKACLLGQNAGFLLSVNALTGLGLHHAIPVLLLLAQRGGPEDDQYFQSYKGRVTAPVLDAINVPHHSLDRIEDAGIIGDAWRQAWLARYPAAVLMTGRFLRGRSA